jgi:antitoxin (DNA-binding transcriptional repressor) of toxin-antitoxin stability system
MERAVGIRKLRDEMTRHLGRVRRGVRIEITDRGQPVAILLPYVRGGRPTRAERLGLLLSGGHVAPAEKQFLREPSLVRGRGPLLSDLIGETRR